MKHLGASYSDVLIMPTYKRKEFLQFLNNDYETQKEQMDEIKQKNGHGKKRLSGNDVKAFALKQQKNS